MTLPPEEPIAALASPEGPSPCAVVRVTGAGCWARLESLVVGRGHLEAWQPAMVEVRWAPDAAPVPAVIVPYAKGASYTGEESAELLVPGSPPLVRRLLETLRENGLRPAEPGEFTRRAFLSGRIDLTAAESVGLLIAAETRQEARVVRDVLEGRLAREVRALGEILHDLIALLEAGLDFAEQEVPPPDPAWLDAQVAVVESRMELLLSDPRHRATEAPRARVVLWGRPNAGKSSLLNCLAGREVAITSDEAGTTRDPVSVELEIPGGLTVELIDPAGFQAAGEEEAGPVAPDEIEGRAARLAEELLHGATWILHVLDATRPSAALREEWEGLTPAIRTRSWPVLNQIDQPGALTEVPGIEDALAVSARTGLGASAIRDRLLAELRGGDWISRGAGAIFTERQRGCLEACRQLLGALRRALPVTAEPELVVVDIRSAHACLEEITGAVTTEATLDRIFQRFCLGK